MTEQTTAETQSPPIAISSEEISAVRNNIFANYSRFKPMVDDIKSRLRTEEDVIDAALGIGNNGTAAVPLQFEGQNYVLRMSSDPRLTVNITDRLEGAIRGFGIKGLEQVVAASIPDHIFISEMMPGKSVRYIGPQLEQQITDQQLANLIESIMKANTRGIAFDTEHENILYDPFNGFGLIDYDYSEDVRHSLSITLNAFAVPLATMGRGLRGKNFDDHQRREQTKIDLQLLSQFGKQCETRIQGKDRERIQQGIKNIEYTLTR